MTWVEKWINSLKIIQIETTYALPLSVKYDVIRSRNTHRISNNNNNNTDINVLGDFYESKTNGNKNGGNDMGCCL